jgi:hypothetical protein
MSPLIDKSCDCRDVRSVLTIYNDFNGLGTLVNFNCASGRSSEVKGPIRTVKIRCHGCGRVYLQRMTMFPRGSE